MISMTGFAARRGSGAGYAWAWDLRSVNGKGLDLRLRVPDWIDGLEPAIRAELQKALTRGNVSLTLKVAQDEGRDDTAFRLNQAMLSAALAAVGQVEAAAMEAGVTLRQAMAADVLTLRCGGPAGAACRLPRNARGGRCGACHSSDRAAGPDRRAYRRCPT